MEPWNVLTLHPRQLAVDSPRAGGREVRSIRWLQCFSFEFSSSNLNCNLNLSRKVRITIQFKIKARKPPTKISRQILDIHLEPVFCDPPK
jgi:hypothetical protein